MLKDVMDSMLEAIANRHGVSVGLMTEFLDVAFIASKIGSKPDAQLSADDFGKHDAFLAKIAVLEMKGRRYDLLIEAEKATHNMAGK